jgi:hypothetical protein
MAVSWSHAIHAGCRIALDLAAAGLLTLAVPVVTLATGAGLTVTAGTTITPPVSVELGGVPGGVGVGRTVALAWWSNDGAMVIRVVASDLLCIDASCGAPGAPDGIAGAAVSFRSLGTAAEPASRSGVIAIIAGGPSERASRGTFPVSIAIPVVRPGRYAGSLDYAVMDPDHPGAPDRVFAGPDGSRHVGSRLLVTVGRVTGPPDRR